MVCSCRMGRSVSTAGCTKSGSSVWVSGRRDMGHWAAAFLGRLAGDGDDFRQLFCAERRRHPRAWPVAQDLEQQLPHVPVAGVLLLWPPRGPLSASAQRRRQRRASCSSAPSRRPCAALLTPSADSWMIRHRSMSRYGVSALFRTHFSRSPRWRSDTTISTAVLPILPSALQAQHDPRGSGAQCPCEISAEDI